MCSRDACFPVRPQPVSHGARKAAASVRSRFLIQLFSSFSHSEEIRVKVRVEKSQKLSAGAKGALGRWRWPCDAHSAE